LARGVPRGFLAINDPHRIQGDTMKRKGFALLAVVLLSAAPALAANGHLLHGIGAVNSAMGGAGVALPNDALGALNLNPALLTQIPGHRMEFSAEYNTAKNAVESRVGPFSGRTEESGDPALIPAFGWTRDKTGHFAYGVGFLGMAGFGVDYPQDPRNPILAPQPRGLGRVFSNYQFMKVPTALAWQLTPALSLGVSLNAGRAALTANPAGFATPDCSGPAGPCFVPSVESDSAFGWGATVGAYYKVNPTLAIGGSYTSEQKFQDFEWNSTVANPNLPTYGTARRIRFKLNAPATFVVGLGYTPTDRLKVALDAKRVNYKDTDGFGDVLGWKDIDVFAVGAQYQASNLITLRLGYNSGQSPISGTANFTSIEAPAVFRNHVTGGLGLQVNEALQLNLGYYHVFKNRSSGPFLSPSGPVPGTQVTNEMAMDSVLATFSFKL
jgi:long-chain fatty acid transport protein